MYGQPKNSIHVIRLTDFGLGEAKRYICIFQYDARDNWIKQKGEPLCSVWKLESRVHILKTLKVESEIP